MHIAGGTCELTLFPIPNKHSRFRYGSASSEVWTGEHFTLSMSYLGVQRKLLSVCDFLCNAGKRDI